MSAGSMTQQEIVLSKKFHIHTFGCQMNVHDSEKIAGIFSESGYQESENGSKPDVIVLNTCSIREKAEQKFYSELGRLRAAKKHNPNLRIAVAGCIAQQEGEKIFKRFPYVDYVFGPDNIDDLESWIKDRAQNTEHRTQTTALSFNPENHTKSLPMKREGGVKAGVSIMYGCDNFCAYCVVPHTRGRERSRPSSDIYNEISRLADEGFKEVTLLGQNVNSYGKGLDEGVTFPLLLEKLNEIEGIERIRFVTSHPKDLSDDLIDSISGLSKVCEHIHLPLQAGSDRVLKMMNRVYTLDDYIERVEMLRDAVPGIAITSDIITGFPGETDEDFKMTVKALESIRFDGIFAFKYSKRPGTKALELSGHIDEKIKSDRLSEVLRAQEAITSEKNRAYEGRTVEILAEGPSGSDPGMLTGRTRTNKIVNYQGDSEDAGKLLQVRIQKGMQHSLFGERV
jgi:tRNA-2-methylthio-N6-dimethylallyladenosine synthase